MYTLQLSCDECFAVYCFEAVRSEPGPQQCIVCDSKRTVVGHCLPSPAEAKAAIEGATEPDLRAIRMISRVFGPGVREVESPG